MRKLALATLVGGVLSIASVSVLADIGSPFPSTHVPVDHTVPAGSDTTSPFPKQFGPVDRSVDVAMNDAVSSFPKSYGPAGE